MVTMAGMFKGQEVDRIDTVIGQGVEIKGTFVSKSTIRVEGRVEGNVQSEGDVIAGKEGRIKGDIHARTIVVAGRVNGNVFAESRVEIQNGGQLFGDIKAPVVVINEGGIFEGHCEMSSKDKGKILELGERELSEEGRRRTMRE